MHRIVFSLLTIGTFVPAAIASADPIRITGGGLTGNSSSVDVHIESTERGFSMTGLGDEVDGVYAPSFCVGCQPGSAQSLEAYWSSGDFLGTMSIDGTTFEMGGGDREAGGIVHFEGAWTAPAYAGAATATVVSPFTFTGGFSYPAFSGYPYGLTPLVGEGVATLALQWSRPLQGWLLSSADYRFASEEPAATPEPASLLLLGSGVLGLAARRRRKQAGA